MPSGQCGEQAWMNPGYSRRRLLGLAATLPVIARAGRCFATTAGAAPAPPPMPLPFADGVTLLVAGPENGVLNRWADALQPPLEQSLPPDTTIKRLTTGGADGVTGANQFETRAAPDGLTIMLVPGDALLAWLIGDPRAQFDVGHWVAVAAGVTPGLVAGRPGAVAADKPLRIGAATPGGPDLPALLGCELLGARLEPVLGLTGPGAALTAFSQNAIDALLLHGHNVSQQMAAMAAVGGQPVFALPAFDDAGAMVRDPMFPDVPLLAELMLGGLTKEPLHRAWRAAAVASRLEYGLILPQLTPAAMVALWRRAGTDAVAAPAIQTMTGAAEVRPLVGVAAPAAITAAAVDAGTLLELRRWLAKRFDWHPT
jgi:hypothetical protein